MTDRFTRLLGIQQPIIQAPMLGVSTPALAAAVSNAGGLGSIAITGSAAEKGRALIREVRGLTDKPFNVNLFCHRPGQADPARERAWLDYLKPLFAEFGAEPPARLNNIYLSFLEDPTLLPMLLEERPAAVSFHFGAPPRDQVRALQAAGIRVLVSATTPEEAALVEAAGADAVVAQGIEAGGHRGVFEPERGDAAIGTLALVGPPAGGARFATGGGCRRDHGRTGHPRRPGAGRERRADGHRLRPLSGVLGQRRLPRGAEGAARGAHRADRDHVRAQRPRPAQPDVLRCRRAWSAALAGLSVRLRRDQSVADRRSGSRQP